MGVINRLLTGMILQVGSLQPRKHNSKTVHSKLPNCQINSIVSRKLNGSLNGPATVHYCRSGLSTKFFLVERLFTPNKIPRLSYSPIVYMRFFVGIHNISCCLTSSRLKSRWQNHSKIRQVKKSSVWRLHYYATISHTFGKAQIDNSFMLAAMGTHGSFIFKGYFTHILGPKTCIFDGFGVQWWDFFHGWKGSPESIAVRLFLLCQVLYIHTWKMMIQWSAKKSLFQKETQTFSKTEKHHHVYQEEPLFVHVEFRWI